jgi:tight adherence protein B
MSVLVIALIGAAVAVIMLPSAGVARRLQGSPAFRLRLPVVDGTAAVRRPARVAGIAAAAGGLTGLLLGGPVAAIVLAAYLLLGVRAWVRWTVRRSAAAVRAQALDDLSALAADLRAGLPPATAADRTLGRPPAGIRADAARAGAVPGLRGGELHRRTEAVWALADQTGAPAADLVERIETDARAADRSRAAASAEAAGAQATAMLLAALPVGGIGLGFGLGANPVRILLHTPVGAACAIVAVLLQAAGLVWCERLATGGPR